MHHLTKQASWKLVKKCLAAIALADPHYCSTVKVVNAERTSSYNCVNTSCWPSKFRTVMHRFPMVALPSTHNRIPNVTYSTCTAVSTPPPPVPCYITPRWFINTIVTFTPCFGSVTTKGCPSQSSWTCFTITHSTPASMLQLTCTYLTACTAGILTRDATDKLRTVVSLRPSHWNSRKVEMSLTYHPPSLFQSLTQRSINLLRFLLFPRNCSQLCKNGSFNGLLFSRNSLKISWLLQFFSSNSLTFSQLFQDWLNSLSFRGFPGSGSNPAPLETQDVKKLFS